MPQLSSSIAIITAFAREMKLVNGTGAVSDSNIEADKLQEESKLSRESPLPSARERSVSRW
tara:strand:- start:309 stop:491 length:183 start_codon:yes stop_codon:yes gene_type:complete